MKTIAEQTCQRCRLDKGCFVCSAQYILATSKCFKETSTAADSKTPGQNSAPVSDGALPSWPEVLEVPGVGARLARLEALAFRGGGDLLQ